MEELRKHVTWMSNKAYIEQHNQYSDTFGYTLKMNNFGDLVRQRERGEREREGGERGERERVYTHSTND